MKTLIFILLIGTAAAQTVSTAGASAAVAGSTRVDDDGDLLFDYDPTFGDGYTAVFQNRTVIGVSPALKIESAVAYQHANANGGGAETIEPNPNDGNRVQLHITGGNYPCISWFSNRNNDVWGHHMGYMTYVFDRWSYSGSWVSTRLLMQHNGKANDAAGLGFDFNQGSALRTTNVGGGSTPGLVVSPDDLAFLDTAANAPKRIEYRRRTLLSNPENLYTEVLYVSELAGSFVGQTRSGWSRTTLTSVNAGPTRHQMQIGNDTNVAFEMWFDRVRVHRGTPGSDSFDLPVNLWMDFDACLIAINTTQLGLCPGFSFSNRTARTFGSLTGFSATADADLPLPNTVNLKTDARLAGLRRDLTVTAGGGMGYSRASTTASQQVTMFAYRPANLATGTTVRVAFAGPTSAPSATTSQYLSVEQWNDSGQQKLRLINRDGGTSTGAINVTAGTPVSVSISYDQGADSMLQVRDLATGVQLGSTVTLATPNVAFGGWYFGSFDAVTAQSPGVYFDIDDGVMDLTVTAMWPISFSDYPNR